MASSKTVLIVENDEDTRFVFGAVLNHDGYRVVEARDGREGVEMAARHLPDVILMDIHMPIMDGWQASEAIRADERTAGIPIVAVTAEPFVDPDVRARADRVFHSCLWKPLDARQLMGHVQGIIGDP